MTNKNNKITELQEDADLDKTGKKLSILKATLIGVACGVFFIMAAKMVSIALA